VISRTGGTAGGTLTAPRWTDAVASCIACHGVPPGTGRHPDHANFGYDCGSCHAGYASSTVNRTTHVDGAKQVGNQLTSYDPTARTCANLCHPDKPSRTW
jgi:hypothetical protein